jgi:hypothetical protein
MESEDLVESKGLVDDSYSWVDSNSNSVFAC